MIPTKARCGLYRMIQRRNTGITSVPTGAKLTFMTPKVGVLLLLAVVLVDPTNELPPTRDLPNKALQTRQWYVLSRHAVAPQRSPHQVSASQYSAMDQRL